MLSTKEAILESLSKSGLASDSIDLATIVMRDNSGGISISNDGNDGNDGNDKNAAPCPTMTMPWEEDGWVPRTPSGQQKTPNMIRNQLQKYIDNSERSQTDIVHNELGLNYSSFGKFMNPKHYKGAWSATRNGTYLAGARLLAQKEYEQKQGKKINNNTDTKQITKQTKKRKKDAPEKEEEGSNNNKSKKKAKASKSPSGQDMDAYMALVNATPLPENDEENKKVYDSCPQVITKIKEFLSRDGVTKASFCRILGNLNSNSLNRFLSTKKQDGAGMVAYERAYFFFEKMRILEGTKKSKARLDNEVAFFRTGFALKAPSRGGWYVVAR